jgi:hypothetical protein
VLYYGVAVFRQPNFKEETSIWDNLHKKDNSLNVIIKYTRKQKQRAQQSTTNTQYNKEKKHTKKTGYLEYVTILLVTPITNPIF